ncbi:MAG: SEC-C domain-containing protein [Tissierellales bacterium]|jgi:preprotein translocase subunit SecA|nr:SEC-C domain-containing protein [Tissierellales bacterium]
MAGRGTDIVLGGNPEHIAKTKLKDKVSEEIAAQADGFDDTDDPDVISARKIYKNLLDKAKEDLKDENKKVIEAGGLAIIGTERHESRRIDNQLRGRAGRQGDPGTSRFYISLEDDLMRLFAGDKVKAIVDTLGLPEDEPLEHNMLTKSIETAQGRVEGRNFNIRKHVLQYDNVMNRQREVIYSERQKVLMGEDLRDYIFSMIEEIVDENMVVFTVDKYPENWDIEGYERFLSSLISSNVKLKIEDIESLTKEKLREITLNLIEKIYERKEEEFQPERFREIERVVLLKTVDSKWIDHIDAMDQLRQGISLRAMGNEDPVRAYTKEGFEMFEGLISSIKEDTVKILLRIQEKETIKRKSVAKVTGTNKDGAESKQQTVVKGEKVGRNDPCPCGSGKKYKKCCGR